MTINEALALAVQHHQGGRLQAAEQIYHQILAVEPNHVAALHLLGVIARQLGKPEVAVRYIGHAIRLNPDYAEAHNNLGNALRDQGKLDEAVASYRRALELMPDYVEAQHNLGHALIGQGRLADAIGCYRRTLELKPDHVGAWFNLGNALMEQGSLGDAMDCYRRATELKPDYAEAHNNLGHALKEAGKLDDAVACHRRALELKPDYAEAYFNLGSALKNQEKLDEAIACYRRALELRPNFAEIHNNLGTAFNLQGRVDDAVACFQRALELKPGLAMAHCNLGAVYWDAKQFSKAIGCFHEAIRLNPDYWEAHRNLGAALCDVGRLQEATASLQLALQLMPTDADIHRLLGEGYRRQNRLPEAIASLQKADRLRPENPATLSSLVRLTQHLCDWEHLNDLSQNLLSAIEKNAAEANTEALPEPFVVLVLPRPSTAEQQQSCARRWVNQILRRANRGIRRPESSRPRSDSPVIRVGYLSADFHQHATAYLIAELFEQHDRKKISVHGYSIGIDDGGPMRKRLSRSCDRFIDLRDSSFTQAAQRIEADEIDILVDLKGHTPNARTEILALRPAPIQVNYLGYPGTMGASFIDYILVDDFIVPPDQQLYYTEQLVHLPGCYQVNDGKRSISSHVPTRAECHLPETGFVFCCFNNSYKFTPALFEVWMQLLKAVPASVLWLLESNAIASGNLRKEAEARGVAAERVVFAPPMPLADHLARHRLADMFLDTFPVNAHTTASDALWAGCPIVTMPGETFISRVAGSLLRSLGAPELITSSFAEYRDLALRLAMDEELLGALRTRLRENRTKSLLFDAAAFARNLESAYATMWDIHVAGEKPRPFAVKPS